MGGYMKKSAQLFGCAAAGFAVLLSAPAIGAVTVYTDRAAFQAATGTVEKMFNSVGKGGLTAYVRSDDGRLMYYYAHLAAYDGVLREGERIARGTPIGLVGHTGDASPDGPHLHMAINRMAPGER